MADDNTNDGKVFGAGEFRTTKEPQPGLIKNATFLTKAVRYSSIEGQAIFEGDIVLGTTEQLQQSVSFDPNDPLKGIVIVGTGVRWPQGIVPYEISKSLPNPKRVTDAIEHWEQHTSIRFRKRTDEIDYVMFRPSSGCSASVGRKGGRQFINLGPQCTRGNVIHEIGHTLGLWHEQSREDREQFIEIVWDNIDPDTIHNFDQHIQDGDDIGEYDYASIMHYPKNAFAIYEDKDTIIPRGGQEIGQREKMSDLDIATIKKIYP